jgi:peptidyl-prolyl cis-trans isomerase A (cyclophilin A)
MRRSSALFAIVSLALVACRTAPAEPESAQKDPAPTSTPTMPANTLAKPSQPTPPPNFPAADENAGNGDPLKGSFTLADATKDLKGAGPIVAKIETSKGALQCKLFDDKAPLTVANFIGLATGKRAWKDPASGKWVNKPAYDGTTFHRVIKGFMIQGGDQKGNGSGEPGYVIKDEIWQGSAHDKAGLLCMANRGPNTNGAQFFITDAPAMHLTKAGTYTIFGECAPVEVVHDIASTPVLGERPANPITIKSVTISRDEKKK